MKKEKLAAAQSDISASNPVCVDPLLTPSSWGSSIWDHQGLFEFPPLLPLSPHPSMGSYHQLMVL